MINNILENELEIKGLSGESLDILEEKINKIKEIFPEAICEGKIDFERLSEELGHFKEDKEERYRFEWAGKSKAIKIAQTPSMGTLRPCKEESKNWDTTQNLYIEGDNLEVLKLLQKSYQNKIKMIYIDPPYNTGNDFVYKDDFKDNMMNYLINTGQINAAGKKIRTNIESAGRFHTAWLNMIYPRLRLARNLLSNDGVIFISIDDNELDNLKKICDEVFGENNFLGRIMPIVNPGGRDYKQIALTHEYLLVYAKSDLTELQEIAKDIKFAMNDELGGYELRDLRNRNPKFNSGNRPNLFYPFYINPELKDKYGHYSVSLEKGNGYIIEVKPYNSLGQESVWRWGKIKANKNIRLGNIDASQIVAKLKKDGGYTISEKNRKCTSKVKSIWDESSMRTEEGTRLIRKIFEFTPFDHPKPIELLNRTIEMAGDSEIILDFFSGSSSLAQAVMEMNSRDNKVRKYIMVQYPELLDERTEAYKKNYINICDIAKERIRRAGDKIVSENKDKEGIEDLDIGFKVFKLDSSNIKRWNPNYDNIEQTLDDMEESFVKGRTEEDILYELILKAGIDITYLVEEVTVNDKKIFNIGFGELLVCLDDDITIDIANEIVNLKNDRTKVIFKEAGFKDDSTKTNVLEILKRNKIKEVISV